MLIGPVLQYFFGLIITVLFCAAALLAIRRAPRQFLWLALVAASRCIGSATGVANLVFMNQMRTGRSPSDFSGLMTVQTILFGLSNFLLFGGAIALILFLLNERQDVAPGAMR